MSSLLALYSVPLWQLFSSTADPLSEYQNNVFVLVLYTYLSAYLNKGSKTKRSSLVFTIYVSLAYP
jgi:hypothetical protein